MNKTLNLVAARPWVAFVDDERELGNSIIITLAEGYYFADEPDCGVRGFDTVKDARDQTTRSSVIQRTAP